MRSHMMPYCDLASASDVALVLATHHVEFANGPEPVRPIMSDNN